MLSLDEARARAQAHAGMEAELERTGQPEGLLWAGDEAALVYFSVSRPGRMRIGATELVIVNRVTGQVHATSCGE